MKSAFDGFFYTQCKKKEAKKLVSEGKPVWMISKKENLASPYTQPWEFKPEWRNMTTFEKFVLQFQTQQANKGLGKRIIFLVRN